MTKIYFVNYYQSKNHKQRHQIKKLLYKAIGKCRIKTPRRAMKIKVALFNCTGQMGMNNFGCLNTSFSLFYLYFVTNLQNKKKLLHTYTYIWTSPTSPPIRPSTLLDGHPFPTPNVHSLWMSPSISCYDCWLHQVASS